MSEAATADGGKFYSTIAFPYFDMEDAITVARAMHDAGGVPLDRDQLAGAMKQVPTSGNFNGKVSAARMFGLIDNTQGRYLLTELGFEILDPARERAAKAAAFLNVPLYNRTYETYKGKQLPPRPIGLENAFVTFGVSPRQKDKARHVFDRSARTAGFFASSAEDRLVMPIISNGPTATADEEMQIAAEPSHVVPATAPASHRARRELDPFIEGLLERLPPSLPLPEKTAWSVSDRAKWLQAAAQIFDLIYEGNDGYVAVEFKNKSGGSAG
jgi:hypothetical protein